MPTERDTTHDAGALCWYCKRRTPEPGFKTCGVCRRIIRNRLRARRRERARLGMCTRCGDRKPRKDHTVCKVCAAKTLERSIDTQETRAMAGLCPRCGKRAPAKGRQMCRVCLRAQRDRAKGKRTSTKSADRVAKWRAKQRAAGRCTTCGEPTEINPATGKPYARCELHRDEARARRARRDTDNT